ncbi:MAG: sensor histidine kinase [Janthinobacterium lividum]
MPRSFILRLLCLLRLLCGLVIALLASPTPAHATMPSIAIAPRQAWPINLTPRVAFYEDRSGNADLATVAALPSVAREGFAPIPADGAFPGYGHSSWWLRFDVENSTPRDADLYVAMSSPWLHHVDFYAGENGRWRHTRMGSAVPVAERDPAVRDSRLPIMSLTLPPGGRTRVYIRISGKAPAALAARLYSQKSYDAAEARVVYTVSALIGALALLGWGMLVISILYRTRTFVYMAIGCGLQVLNYLCVYGYARVYLWPDATQWAYRSPTILGLASLAAWSLFFYTGLRLQDVVRFGQRGVTMLMVFMAGLGLLAWLGDISVATQLTMVFDVAFFFGLLWLTFLLYQRNAPTAGLMLCVMLMSTVNFFLQIMQAYGHAPALLQRVSLGIMPEPAYEIFALACNTFILAAWVRRISQLHASAVHRLSDWQREEEQRLRHEVATRTLELQDALRTVEEKNRQKTEMLAFVGHDLRAPLATIAGYVKRLHRDERARGARPDRPESADAVPDAVDAVDAVDADSRDSGEIAAAWHASGPPSRMSAIAAIERSIDYQLRLIDELLEFSRGELQPLQLHADDVRIGDLLDEIVDHAATLAAHRGNRLIFAMEMAVPAIVHTDGTRLRQVLLNLLSNAAKFTRRGSITLDVRVRTQGPRATFHFAVADTGDGIDLPAQQDIFRAFHQIERSRGGVGLGLHIVERILREMHSSLHLQSTPGVGSRFSFDIALPVVDPAPHWCPPFASSSVPSFAPSFGLPVILPVASFDASRAEPVAGRPAAYALSAPPALACASLLSLAEAGSLSDLEEWLDDTIAHHPASREFCAAIREALDRLDFERIVDIAQRSAAVNANANAA